MRVYSKKGPRQTGSVVQPQLSQTEDEPKPDSLLADSGSYNVTNNYSTSKSTSSHKQDNAVRVFDSIPKPYLGLQKQSNQDRGGIVELDPNFWASTPTTATLSSLVTTTKSTKKSRPKKITNTQPMKLMNSPRKRGRPKKDKTVEPSSAVIAAVPAKQNMVEETKVKLMIEPGVASSSFRRDDISVPQSSFNNTSSDSRNEPSIERMEPASDNLLPRLATSSRSHDSSDVPKSLKRRKPTTDRPQRNTRATVEKQNSLTRGKITWMRIGEESLANSITDEELAEAGII
ncbi:hypothetical protein BGZ51_004765 [Haplosporangium sp. Z 767]|nr:hypothetical protein BGZ50_007964 [Haplosporangium sp. Z 11]KAF9182393.1 hypothetical protein BGZ51_004765 [Haplosporangium sp. Z 767]